MHCAGRRCPSRESGVRLGPPPLSPLRRARGAKPPTPHGPFGPFFHRIRRLCRLAATAGRSSRAPLRRRPPFSIRYSFSPRRIFRVFPPRAAFPPPPPPLKPKRRSGRRMGNHMLRFFPPLAISRSARGISDVLFSVRPPPPPNPPRPNGIFYFSGYELGGSNENPTGLRRAPRVDLFGERRFFFIIARPFFAQLAPRLIHKSLRTSSLGRSSILSRATRA